MPAVLRPRLKLPQGHRWFTDFDWVVHVKLRQQAVAVLHQGMETVGQARLLARPLAVEHRLRITCAPVRVVAASLPLEIDRRIARVIILALVHLLRVSPILAHKALHRRPGLDQRPVRAEVVIARPSSLPALVVNSPEKQNRHFPRQHPFGVLRKHRVIPASLLHLPIQEPHPQNVPLQLIAEAPLAPHAVQRHQHPRLEQLLRRDRGASTFGGQFLKKRAQAFQRLIAELLDRSQRMRRRNPRLRVQGRQKLRLGNRSPSHAQHFSTTHKSSFS